MPAYLPVSKSFIHSLYQSVSESLCESNVLVFVCKLDTVDCILPTKDCPPLWLHKSDSQREMEWGRERERVCERESVCVWVRFRVCVCVCVWVRFSVCVREREREGEGEREREKIREKMQQVSQSVTISVSSQQICLCVHLSVYLSYLTSAQCAQI